MVKGVVVTYLPQDGAPLRAHQEAMLTDVGRAIARLTQHDFAGAYDPTANYHGHMLFVPGDTLLADEALRLGIKSAARVRQWHLDLAMLGTATIACGLAVEEPPRVAAIALRIGSWTNAMAFLPLAFKPELEHHPAFGACAVASFLATSIGFSGMARAGVRRRRA